MYLADLYVGDPNRPGAASIRVRQDPSQETHLFIDILPAEDKYRPTTVSVSVRREGEYVAVIDTREESK